MYTVETRNEEGRTIERKTFGYASYASPLAAARDYANRMREHLHMIGRNGCTVGLNLDD